MLGITTVVKLPVKQTYVGSIPTPAALKAPVLPLGLFLLEVLMGYCDMGRHYIKWLEERLQLLEYENAQLQSFIIRLGDRLLRNAEKFSVLAEKKITKRESRSPTIELNYKGLVAGDRVAVLDESVNPNCDGSGRDLPKMPWDDTSYTCRFDYGTVQLVTNGDGSRSELHFINKLGSNRPISSFTKVRKITELEWEIGEPRTISYEKDKDGNHVPCGTAKREYCRSNN